MSSSEDDRPLSKRPGASGLVRKKTAAPMESPPAPPSARAGLRTRPARRAIVSDATTSESEDAADSDQEPPESPPPAHKPPAIEINLSQALQTPDRRMQGSSQASLAGDAPTCLPLLVPERLPAGKYLLELGPVRGADGRAAVPDLSGDSGAVGRVQILKHADSDGLLIDLKGGLYEADVVPCAATLGILNVVPTGVRIESFFSEVIRMRERKEEEEGAQPPADLGWEEEDQPLFVVESQQAQEEPPAKKPARKKVVPSAPASQKGTARKAAPKIKGAARKKPKK